MERPINQVTPPQGIGWGLIMTGLGLIFIWIGFGPGERRFHGGITGSPIEGRIAFGIAAAVLTRMAGAAWVTSVRELRARFGGGPRTRLPQKTPPLPRPPQR